MGRVFAAISHKGGTGRSVTMANVATCAALRGRNVCIVDLDLASPTFGSIVGLDGVETGVPLGGHPTQPKSVFDILARMTSGEGEDEYRYVDHALLNMWKGSAFKGTGLDKKNSGLFLLPGRQNASDAFQPRVLAPALDKLLGQLAASHDFIICDVRSGISHPFTAFLLPQVRQHIAGYLFHFRWTPQQLSGLGDLLKRDKRIRDVQLPLEKVRFIQTAKIPTETVAGKLGLKGWLEQNEKGLVAQFDELKKFATDYKQDVVLGEVPLDPVLQWRETIISQRMVQDGIANSATLQAFDMIAEKMINMID
jgi:MinD-like ATPase involved in chromosome partitioning or flagellar assembly